LQKETKNAIENVEKKYKYVIIKKARHKNRKVKIEKLIIHN
jgi:hypothetical protein